ncbi:MAG: chemotaxis protein CheX [Lachnospiraceae bacterium]
MFGVYFGKYLADKGMLTMDQLADLLTNSANSKVKLGLLAVEYGYMSSEQADEVNMLQQLQDKRFGDIAVEKGYLTDDQVGELLESQGDSYLLFIQALTENNILALGDIQTELNEFKSAEGFTAKDIEALKSGDVDRITPIFMKDEAIPKSVKDYISLMARNLVRFIDRNFRMERVEIISAYQTEYLASQSMDGDHKIFVGFGGDGEGIRKIAEGYAKEDFPEVDMDVIDAACEFLNCNNGLYATNACESGVEVDMEPPVMKVEAVDLTSGGVMYRVPMTIQNGDVDLIIGFDSDVTML